jgi:hypothetical protein
MREYEHKIEVLREQRASAVDALDAIYRGATITKDGVDMTERQRRHLQTVLLNLDAVIIAYENIDADRT